MLLRLRDLLHRRRRLAGNVPDGQEDDQYDHGACGDHESLINRQPDLDSHKTALRCLAVNHSGMERGGGCGRRQMVRRSPAAAGKMERDRARETVAQMIGRSREGEIAKKGECCGEEKDTRERSE